MKPSLSICIVVRNAVLDLERTLESLDRQRLLLNRLPAEYVIVDGYSTDGSFSLLRDWSSNLRNFAHLVQQAPSGIYPAMNLAWRIANGDWLLFINAGDVMIDAAPLAPAFAMAQEFGASSIQFQSAIFRPGCSLGYWMPDSFPACHQSLVYRRELHQHLGPYDERLHIVADRLFDISMRGEDRIQYPGLLSATQVFPANASRDPIRLKRDWITTRQAGMPFSLGSLGWLTFFVLKTEQRLGVSLSVWMRLWLLLLLGRARLVPLG